MRVVRPPITMTMPMISMNKSPRVVPPGPMTAPVMWEMPLSSPSLRFWEVSSWFSELGPWKFPVLSKLNGSI